VEVPKLLDESPPLHRRSGGQIFELRKIGGRLLHTELPPGRRPEPLLESLGLAAKLDFLVLQLANALPDDLGRGVVGRGLVLLHPATLLGFEIGHSPPHLA
jgi:hypothetical protein